MILAKNKYEIFNNKLLAIIEAFKTWKHYLQKSQHKELVLNDNNNFCKLMDIKSLSSRPVYWAQELFRYYF